MELLFIGILVAAAFRADISSAVPLRNNTDRDGWFVPTVDGKFFWMSREELGNEKIQPMERKPISVKYFLYTRENPETPEQVYMNVGSLASSRFNKDKPTRFIVHGWRSDLSSEFVVQVRDALIEVEDLNLICVDWSSASLSLNYPSAKNAVPTVGRALALFIDFLNAIAGMPFDNLALIGYSIGAHVCGYAGKNVKRGRIGVITGLDPASALYDYSNCDTRLCSTDALFVDSIQTNGQLCGFLEPIGNVAYYPNGGKSQPGCSFDLTEICSHSRAYVYYVEALLQNNFVAIKCSNYKAAVGKDCEESLSNAKMGSLGGHPNDGCYYVPVNKKSPYGTG